MTGKNLRFRVYVSNYVCDTEEYNDVTSNEVLDIIREVDGYYKTLEIFAKMND